MGTSALYYKDLSRANYHKGTQKKPKQSPRPESNAIPLSTMPMIQSTTKDVKDTKTYELSSLMTRSWPTRSGQSIVSVLFSHTASCLGTRAWTASRASRHMSFVSSVSTHVCEMASGCVPTSQYCPTYLQPPEDGCQRRNGWEAQRRLCTSIECTYAQHVQRSFLITPLF